MAGGKGGRLSGNETAAGHSDRDLLERMLLIRRFEEQHKNSGTAEGCLQSNDVGFASAVCMAVEKLMGGKRAS